jgi:peptidoglycan-N-acetylglucosamine deacetylase
MRVLHALRDCRAQGTFFVIGERVQSARELLPAIIETGNEVQLHCHRHIRHTDLSELEIERDTGEALAALADLGVRPTYWRTPWGVQTPATIRVAKRHGLTLVNWTIDTHDWRGDPAAVMLARARAQLVDGGVVLMHDGLGPGAMRVGCENTVELLKPLVAAAKSEGLEVGPPLVGVGKTA